MVWQFLDLACACEPFLRVSRRGVSQRPVTAITFKMFRLWEYPLQALPKTSMENETYEGSSHGPRADPCSLIRTRPSQK
jgi:hypothetical protein